MNRILLDQHELDAHSRAVLNGRRADHILAVLTPGIGTELKIGIVNGPLGTGRVERIGNGAITLVCELGCPPPPPRIDLILAMPRPKVLRRFWPVVSSLGIQHLFIVNARKVEKPYFATHWLQAEYYLPRLRQGLEQSGDTCLPRVSVHRQFRPFVEDELDAVSPATLRLCGHPGGEPLPSLQADQTDRALVAVGPEGGWDPFEIELLASRGFRPVSLGWRVLHTASACVALVTAAGRFLTPETGPGAA